MAVDDHGLEVLKKAGEEIVPGNKSDHYIKIGGLPSTSPGTVPPVGVAIDPVPSRNTIEQIKFLLDGITKNMNVDGSSVNVEYEFSPVSGEIFQLNTVCFYMGESGGLAFNKFENIALLTNGLLLEIQSEGTLREFVNLQANADMGVVFFGGGSTGSKSSWEGQTTFGSSTKLNGDQGDFIRATIRDDLSTVQKIQMAITVSELV